MPEEPPTTSTCLPLKSSSFISRILVSAEQLACFALSFEHDPIGNRYRHFRIMVVFGLSADRWQSLSILPWPDGAECLIRMRAASVDIETSPSSLCCNEAG
jgi:hypothetical protein